MSLLNLTKAQTFCIYELIDIIIVCKHQNFVFVALQVVMLGFKSFNNSQKLTIVSFVPYFSWKYLPQKVCYWVLLVLIGG